MGRRRFAVFKLLPDGTMGLVVRTVSRLGFITTRPIAIAATAALLFVTNLVIGFPGVPVDDSDFQYAQAVAQHFNDWHPPIMAWLWSVFRLIADGNGQMFCFHVACYWLGFGLVAAALGRTGRPLAAWGVLGVGLFPPFLMMNVIILKDVGLAVTFLAAFAALFWYRIRDRKVPLAVVAISIILLFYGTLARTNAVFGVVPLLAYMINPRWLERPWRLLLFSIPIAMFLVPVSNLFNHSVLKATPLGLIRSLEIFDLTGIAFYSGDLSVFGPGNSFIKQDVDKCYSAIGWDALSPWGNCRFFWNRLAVSQDLQGVEKLDSMAVIEARPNPDLPDLWGTAIIEHPLAYARHRLAHFSSEMLGAAMGGAIFDAWAPPMQERRLYLVLYDALTTPALWLAIGACLLVLLALVRRLQRSPGIEAALALDISGLTYTCAYLIVGVASDSRYQFWSMVATFVALVISSSELRAPFVSLPIRSGRPGTREPIAETNPFAKHN